MAMKYSRQREAIWNYIKDRKDHPTAENVYLAVKSELPNISLGTVYRNLMLLRNTGKLRTIDVGDGLTHFDPNVEEHEHFICRRCGKVVDIDALDSASACSSAAKNFPGRIDGFTAYFYGLCEECANAGDTSGTDSTVTGF